MSSISITDIKSSVKIPSLIKDPIIRNGVFGKLPNDELIMYSGGFTAVFPVEVQGVKWAFRCWHTDLGNMRKRMELISEELKAHILPYFCEFAYEDEGVVINGKIYPTTRMKWVEGEDIKDYICSHSNRNELEDLANKFLTMCRDLHKRNYAHGDLQHGNIMVSSTGELVLIDYDSMYVPTMQNEFGDIITGLKDYQHPCRKNNSTSSNRIDYFSELVIYLSILAIAERPALIEEYDLANADRLLFSASDYQDLKHSNIYKQVYALQGNFPLLLHILEGYLNAHSIDELESFDVLLDRYALPPEIKLFESDGGLCHYKGESVRLHWEVENYTSLYLSDTLITGKTHINTEKLSATQQFRLEAINGLHHVSSELTITIVESPEISLKLTPHKLKKGKNEQATLQWNIRNAQSAILLANGAEEGIELNGNKALHPQETTTYIVRALGLDGKTTFDKQVTLYVVSESTIVFHSDKLFTLPNVPVLLTWNVEHAKSVELEGYGKVAERGQRVVDIERDTTFELKVTDHFGIKREKIEVRILPLPIIKSILVPVPQISKTMNINNRIPSLQATIPMLQHMVSPIDASKLSLPTFEGLDIEMKEIPAFVFTPKFHLLNLDIKRTRWWNTLGNSFRELNKIIKRII